MDRKPSFLSKTFTLKHLQDHAVENASLPSFQSAPEMRRPPSLLKLQLFCNYKLLFYFTCGTQIHCCHHKLENITHDQLISTESLILTLTHVLEWNVQRDFFCSYSMFLMEVIWLCWGLLIQDNLCNLVNKTVFERYLGFLLRILESVCLSLFFLIN